MQIAPFKLERFLARYEFNTPHLMCCSDCESLTIQALLAMEEGAVDRFMALGLGYTESPGDPRLREEIAGLYENISPEQVLVHSGAEEAIFNFMNVALEAGDHIIVHSPCYQSLTEVARALGCEVSLWEADQASGWALDLDRLRKLLQPRTRVVVINSPHNPTGYLMPQEDFEDLIKLSDHLLNPFFQKHDERFTWTQPKAGPIAFPLLKKGDVVSFCRDLAEKAGVLLLPGTVYDKGYNHFRIGFGRADFPACLAQLEAYLA